MSARPWYKRYPADFIAGTLQLSLEEKGAYSIVLDLIYDRGGPIPDDPQWIARVCGCSVRKWNQIRDTLILEGKIYSAAGLISNFRAEKQVENEAKDARKLSENGAKGAEKTNEKKADLFKNNNLDKKGPDEKARHARGYMPETREDTIVSSLPPSPQSDVVQAFALFNETAARAGIPTAQRLNKVREGRIKARLRDCGGLDGWAVAMAKLEASDFCTGKRNDFKATIDFILQESSFTKLMEGNYDNGQRGTTSAARGGLNDGTVEGFSRAAAIHARNRQRGPVQAGPADNPGDLFTETAGSRRDR